MYSKIGAQRPFRIVFSFACLLTILLPQCLEAEPLEKAACRKLIDKHNDFLRQGVAQKLARGHEWAQANLTDVELKQIRLFLLNEEIIIFRCAQKIKTVARNPELSNSKYYVAPEKITPRPIGPAIEIPPKKPEAYRVRKDTKLENAAKTNQVVKTLTETPGSGDAKKPDSSVTNGLSKSAAKPGPKFIQGNASTLTEVSKPADKSPPVTSNATATLPAQNKGVTETNTSKGNDSTTASIETLEKEKPKPQKVRRPTRKKVKKQPESPHKLFFSVE